MVGALHAADEIRRSVVICFNMSSLVKVRELEGLAQVKGVVRGVEPGILEYREG